jgi:hypothetical protein
MIALIAPVAVVFQFMPPAGCQSPALFAIRKRKMTHDIF